MTKARSVFSRRRIVGAVGPVVILVPSNTVLTTRSKDAILFLTFWNDILLLWFVLGFEHTLESASDLVEDAVGHLDIRADVFGITLYVMHCRLHLFDLLAQYFHGFKGQPSPPHDVKDVLRPRVALHPAEAAGELSDIELAVAVVKEVPSFDELVIGHVEDHHLPRNRGVGQRIHEL